MKSANAYIGSGLCAAVLIFAGCTARLELAVSEQGDVAAEYSAGFGAAFRDSFSALMDTDSGRLFDGAEIARLLTEAGFRNASVRTPDDFSLEASALLPGGAAVSASSAADLISQETDAAGRRGVKIRFSAETMRKLYSVLPEEVRSYIDLFLAPVFTGEVMTDGEYTDILASLYGQALADELSSAELQIVLVSPSGRRQSRKIPLFRLLNLSDDIVFSSEI